MFSVKVNLSNMKANLFLSFLALMVFWQLATLFLAALSSGSSSKAFSKSSLQSQVHPEPYWPLQYTGLASLVPGLVLGRTIVLHDDLVADFPRLGATFQQELLLNCRRFLVSGRGEVNTPFLEKSGALIFVTRASSSFSSASRVDIYLALSYVSTCMASRPALVSVSS
jgi:hypothetical protein